MYRSVKTYTNSASKRGIAAKSGSCARPVPQSNYGDNARKSHCQKRMARLPSMRLPCHLRAALADEDVELDHVAVLDQRQRPPHRRLGRGVQHDAEMEHQTARDTTDLPKKPMVHAAPMSPTR